MDKLLMALYDTKGYMKSLADYLGRKNFLLDSRLFTKVDSLNDFLREQRPDVLLLGQEVDKTGIRFLDHALNLIILSEGNMVAERGEDYPLIFKYQPAEKVLKEILQIIAQSDEQLPVSLKIYQGQTEFLGIYRPYGNPFPIQRVLDVKGEAGKKSLLLNLEPLNGMGKTEDFRGMSEIIFYLKQKNEKLAAKLRALTRRRDDLDYLWPVEDFRDLYSIGREDVDRLLATLANETDYERIIFDIGFLTDSSLYLLYCCDRIYIPKAKSVWEENQKNALEELLVREGLEEVIDSIRYVAS